MYLFHYRVIIIIFLWTERFQTFPQIYYGFHYKVISGLVTVFVVYSS